MPLAVESTQYCDVYLTRIIVTLTESIKEASTRLGGLIYKEVTNFMFVASSRDCFALQQCTSSCYKAPSREARSMLAHKKGLSLINYPVLLRGFPQPHIGVCIHKQVPIIRVNNIIIATYLFILWWRWLRIQS